MTDAPSFDAPSFDLVFERTVDLPQSAIWQAWTTPELILQWFTPAPWQTVACEIDLRRGGRFHTIMRSPEGQEFPHTGCYLDVVPRRRLVWTNALHADFRPAPAPLPQPCITAVITLSRVGRRTHYHARAMHRDAADAKMHADMGFQEGWGKALDQLVTLMRNAA